jgi:hypothetical protein
MKKTAIISLMMLIGVIGFSQIPSDANLRIQINSLSETNVSLIVSNTKEDVLYEIQLKQNKTNWVSLGFQNGSEITNCMSFASWFPLGFKTNSHIPITAKSIRVRSWIDSYQIGIPDWWQMKYFGNVGVDAYADTAGDLWNNVQKFQNGMDPFRWYSPAGPEGHVTFQEGANAQLENAILTWRCESNLIPNVFTIERAHQTMPGRTDYIVFPLIRHTIDGRIITNWPHQSLDAMYNAPALQRNNFVTVGSYQVIAQVPKQTNILEYRYVETNLNFFPPPVYRIQAHYPEPIQFAELSEVTAAAVSNTILSVTAKQQINGYELTVLHPIMHARYLLLVRDKNDRQWRASGYFVSGTNREPVHLHVDKKGMMADAQSPIALPITKFLPDVIQPEFTAGWGVDSDGDGLPDIYEVLVTHTDPDDADTGETGIPDGFRMISNDGWNNWEKFRWRANPFQKYEPPPVVVLKEPTLSAMMEAQTLKADLPYEPQIEIQTNAAASFEPYSLWLDSYYLNPGISGHARGNARISWRVPLPRP